MKKELGQFYTPNKIAIFAVKESLKHIKSGDINAIELSAGEGHLLSALKQSKPKSEVVAVDIDIKNSLFLKNAFPEAEIIHGDSLKDLSHLSKRSFNLGLGNPPFIKLNQFSDYQLALSRDCLGLDLKRLPSCRAEVLFIARYLDLLEDGGVLAVILPDSIVSGVRAKKFRVSLLKKFHVCSISEIAGGPFTKTEAKTHVLIVRKLEPQKSKVVVQRISSEGRVLKSLKVPLLSLEDRMDYSFHGRSISKSLNNLKDCASIKRGSYTHKDLKVLSCSYIHSTNIQASNDNINLDKKIIDSKSVIARKGDLLMCRVGSRVVGKFRLYMGEDILVSDCIYVIRFHKASVRNKYIKYLKSSQGKEELNSLARGVCSRYLTKEALLTMSVPDTKK